MVHATLRRPPTIALIASLCMFAVGAAMGGALVAFQDALLVDHLHSAEAVDLRTLDDLLTRHVVQRVLERHERSPHGGPDGEHAEAGDQRDGGWSPQWALHRLALLVHSSRPTANPRGGGARGQAPRRLGKSPG